MLRRSGPEHLRQLVLVCLVATGMQQLASAALVKAKAHLAPVLIERAWSRSLDNGGIPQKPWSWADTWPVGRLRVPAEGVDQLVLSGDSGNALAFGPGHSVASAPLGGPGLTVIGGHRDTHFRFLSRLQSGANLNLQTLDGQWRHYRVIGSEIVDSRLRMAQTSEEESLQLVTCYPFDSLDAGGPLRYVVTAKPVFDL